MADNYLMQSQLVRGLPKASTSAIVGSNADNPFVSHTKVRIHTGGSILSSDLVQGKHPSHSFSTNNNNHVPTQQSTRFLSSEPRNDFTRDALLPGLDTIVSGTRAQSNDDTPQETNKALAELQACLRQLEDLNLRGQVSVEALQKQYAEYLSHIVQNDESGFLLEHLWQSMSTTEVPVPVETVNNVIAYRSRWLSNSEDFEVFLATLSECSISLDETSVRLLFNWMIASDIVKDDPLRTFFNFIRVYIGDEIPHQLAVSLIQSLNTYSLVSGIPPLLRELATPGTMLEDDLMVPVARVLGSLRYGETMIQLLQERNVKVSIHTVNEYLNACFSPNVRNLRTTMLH